MARVVPLFTDENPAYEDQIKEAVKRHPAGKKLTPTPVLLASGAQKPVRNPRRV